jgi:hypothetical protein
MDPLIIPILALFIPIVIAPTGMAFKHARHKREYEHTERMRALELGRVLPKDESWWTPARIGLVIGGVVPISAMGSAMIGSDIAGFHEEIWMAAAIVGAAGVICGTILAGKQFFGTGHADQAVEKPQYDPDAYDVVGRRG